MQPSCIDYTMARCLQSMLAVSDWDTTICLLSRQWQFHYELEPTDLNHWSTTAKQHTCSLLSLV